MIETRWDEAGFTEWVNEDVPTVVREMGNSLALLFNMDRTRIVGYRVYDPPKPYVCTSYIQDPCGSARCASCGKRRHEH